MGGVCNETHIFKIKKVLSSPHVGETKKDKHGNFLFLCKVLTSRIEESKMSWCLTTGLPLLNCTTLDKVTYCHCPFISSAKGINYPGADVR